MPYRELILLVLGMAFRGGGLRFNKIHLGCILFLSFGRHGNFHFCGYLTQNSTASYVCPGKCKKKNFNFVRLFLNYKLEPTCSSITTCWPFHLHLWLFVCSFLGIRRLVQTIFSPSLWSQLRQGDLIICVRIVLSFWHFCLVCWHFLGPFGSRNFCLTLSRGSPTYTRQTNRRTEGMFNAFTLSSLIV